MRISSIRMISSFYLTFQKHIKNTGDFNHPVREGWLVFRWQYNGRVFVSIIPTRESWVSNLFQYIICRSSFQSSQPVRVGSLDCWESPGRMIVSIIPTREGWVQKANLTIQEAAVSIIPTCEGWVSNNRQNIQQTLTSIIYYHIRGYFATMIFR